MAKLNFTSTPLFFPGSSLLLLSQHPYLLPPELYRRMGNGGLWSICNTSSPPWALQGCSSFQGSSTYSCVGSSACCSMESWPDIVLYRLQGTAQLTTVFSTSCRRISAPGPGAPPFLVPRWPWCLRSCFSHFFLSSLSQMLCSFLTYVFTEAPPASLMGSCLTRGSLFS